MKTEKHKYSFSVHTYSPEQNKVYYCGVDISSHYNLEFKQSLTKDYRTNLRRIREYNTRGVWNHFITIEYQGVMSGFVRRKCGGFNNWKDAFPYIMQHCRDWFTLEKPVRVVSFGITQKPCIP